MDVVILKTSPTLHVTFQRQHKIQEGNEGKRKAEGGTGGGISLQYLPLYSTQ